MARLLVLGCSRLKHPTPFPVPAWYRYDGVLFRVCKALQAANAFPSDVSIRILSAGFGMITPATPIPLYDQVMDRSRARQLRTTVTAALAEAVHEARATEVFVAAGHTYRAAVGPIQADVPMRFTHGGIGMIQSQLRRWLVGPSPGRGQLAIAFLDPP